MFKKGTLIKVFHPIVTAIGRLVDIFENGRVVKIDEVVSVVQGDRKKHGEIELKFIRKPDMLLIANEPVIEEFTDKDKWFKAYKQVLTGLVLLDEKDKGKFN